MPRTHWTALTVLDETALHDVDPVTRLRKLAEFYRTGGMRGCFFEYTGTPEEREEDASTWGPASPDAVDWTGAPDDWDAVIVLLERLWTHDEGAYGVYPERVAMAWHAHAFDVAAMDSWLAVGICYPKVARELRADGITPSMLPPSAGWRTEDECAELLEWAWGC